MWNNIYNVDKRHPAAVVKRENLDYEYKKNNFYLEYAKSGFDNPDYPMLSIKKNIRNCLYLQLYPD